MFRNGHSRRLVSFTALACLLAAPFAGFAMLVTPQPAGAAITSFTDGSIGIVGGIVGGPDGGVWFTNQNRDTIGRIDATTQTVTEYTGTGISQPTGIALGPDGALWFTNKGNNSIGRIDPSTHAVTNYTGTGIDHPTGIAAGPDGNMWFTNDVVAGSIGMIDLSNDVVANYTSGGFSGTDDPTAITAGPDGNMWFTNEGNNSIGAILTNGSGSIFNWSNGTVSSPQGIAAGSDGALWFANEDNNSIGRIDTSGNITNFTDPGISSPVGIAAGSDGALWFGDSGPVGRITTTGHIDYYNGDENTLVDPTLITNGPDGALWFTNPGRSNGIGRIAPEVVSNYTDPSISNPNDIAVGSDGALWFTSPGNNSIGRIDPTTHAVTSYPVVGDSNPIDITAGPDGALWFTNNFSIGRITTSGTVTDYTGPGISQPDGITAGPDGGVWFTNADIGTIGRIDPSTFAVTSYSDPSISLPVGITAGPDGALWFANEGNNSIGRITTSGTVTNFTDPTLSEPFGITAGPDGALWFTNFGSSSIGRITTSGTVTKFHNSSILYPERITAGPDGALWFANTAGTSVGRITTDGTVSNYAASSISAPVGITTGPDGALWFTNYANNSIGRITPVGAITAYYGQGASSPASITSGPDGALWFLNGGDNTIVRMTTGGTVTNKFTLGGHVPDGLTSGPDGALWFTSGEDDALGRLTTGGALTYYTVDSPELPAGTSWVTGITAGPDGDLWFTNSEAPESIGQMDPSGNMISNTTDPGLHNLNQIIAGPDGGVWFLTNNGDASVGRIDPTTRAITYVSDPSLNGASSITVGPDGALWVTDGAGHAISRIDPGTGHVTVFTNGSIGDGSGGITAGGDGSLWFIEPDGVHVGRMTTDGTVTEIADPNMDQANSMTAGADGALYYANGGNNSIGRDDAGGVANAPTGVTAFAGHGQATVSWSPPANDGSFPVTDYSVTVTDSVGGAPTGVTGAGTRLVGSNATNFAFTGLTNGTVYRFEVAAVNSAGTGTTSTLSNPITPLPPGVGDIDTIAGNGTPAYGGDGGIATAGSLSSPQAVAVDGGGNLIVADYGNSRVRVVARSVSNPGYRLGGCAGACTWTVGRMYTIAGNGTHGSGGDGGPAPSAQMTLPTGVAVDPAGNVVIADYGNGLVRLVAVSPSDPGYTLAGCSGSCTWTVGDIYTVAGNGFGSYNGDGIPATSATLDAKGVAVDSSNNLVLTDFGNSLVRVVAVSGSNPGYVLGGCSGACTWTPGDIYSIAGTGSPGYSGDGGSALSAAVNVNTGITLDGSGNVLFADGHDLIRVVAVSGSNPGYPLAGSGCGGPCTWTQGNIYTVAGTGTSGYNGDGISATSARLDTPSSVAIDPQGNLVIVDSFNDRERVVAMSGSDPGYRLAGCGAPCTWTTGDIYTIAGNGGFFSGDGGPSTLAGAPAAGVGIDGSRGDVYLADSNRIREIAVSSDSRGEVAPSTPPIGATVTVPSDAAWTTQIYNASSIPAHNVVVTIGATANGVTTLSFDNAAINLALGLPSNASTCVSGGGGSELCSIGDIPAQSSVAFTTFVSTAGRAVGDAITGSISVAAANSSGGAGTLGTVTVIAPAACSNCTIGVAVPGASISSPAPTSPASPPQQTVSLPANAAGSSALPPVNVTLQSITPSPAESASDQKLCPTAAGQTHCSGKISSVVADFSKFNDAAHPIQVKVVTDWGSSVPAGKVLMEKKTGGDPLFLLSCQLNAAHRYNTPCLKSETTVGTTNKITTDTIFMTGLDVHFARRVSTGGTVIKPPSAPTGLTVTPGTAAATLTWKAPTATNGAGVTSYVVTVLAAGKVVKSVTYPSPLLTETVTGLANAKAYTFKVAAGNVAGTGAATAVSVAEVVGAPGAPTAVRAVKTSAGHLKVTFTPPALTNGTTITGYTATCTSSNLGVTKSVSGAASPLAVSALSAGKKYTCTVKAKNSRGLGPASAPSPAVTA